jgi:alginate O-acetyltransferase complex protein AlgI
MTLTRVIVLFVFTPMSLWGTRVAIKKGHKGWRQRALSAWVPFMATFQLIALWHSAKYTFVIFGIVHGLWYVIETEIRGGKIFKAYRSRTSDRHRMIAGMAITVVPLMLTFALFRSESLTAFWDLLSALIGVAAPADAYIESREWVKIALAAAIVYLLPNIYEVLKLYRPGIWTFVNPSVTPSVFCVRWRPNLIWGLFLTILAMAVFAKLNLPSPFLYAGF